MSGMDKIVLYVAGTMDALFVLGYVITGQWLKALYWFGATVIVIAVASMGGR